MEPALVDFYPLVAVLIGLAAAAIGGGVLYLIPKIAKAVNLNIDDKTRNYLSNAVWSGIALAEAKALEMVKDRSDVAFKNAKLAVTTQYLVDRVPDALQRFNLSGDALRQYVEGQLAKHERVAAPIAVGALGPIPYEFGASGPVVPGYINVSSKS